MTVLANSYFESLVSKDVETCTQVFPSLLVGNICVRQSIVNKFSGLEYPASLAFVSEPMAEVFALSGFAFLFSEYHQVPGLWQTCKESWEKLLTDAGMRDRLIANVQLVDGARRMPMLTGRSVLRSNWGQRFAQCVAEIPVVTLHEDAERPWASLQIRNHPSLCIRAIINCDMPFTSIHFDPEDIFLDVFLGKEIELDRSDAWRMPDLNESMQRQRELEQRHGFLYESIEDTVNAN